MKKPNPCVYYRFPHHPTMIPPITCTPFFPSSLTEDGYAGGLGHLSELLIFPGYPHIYRRQVTTLLFFFFFLLLILVQGSQPRTQEDRRKFIFHPLQ